MTVNKKSFLGTGWGFPPTFNKDFHGVEMLSDEADIKSSLDILLSTVTGERVMQPLYGCNVLPFVFETINVGTKTLIQKVVTDALIYHEPRIIVELLTLEHYPEKGLLEISIDYRIITTNTRNNYVFPFYYTEGTNLLR